MEHRISDYRSTGTPKSKPQRRLAASQAGRRILAFPRQLGEYRPVQPTAPMPVGINTVQLGKTGTDTNFLLMEIGCLSQRLAALTEQCCGWHSAFVNLIWALPQFSR
jgi:hypothetical protein